MQVDDFDEQGADPLKWRRILALLVQGRQLTRFDVEPHGDHAFNTTVSMIGKKGIDVARKPILIEDRFGSFRCKLYWLEPDQIARARRLLGNTP